MNKKFAIAWAVLFVVWMAGSFVVHGTLLYDEYAQLPNLYRPETEAQGYFPLMLLAHVMLSGAFAWIYARGVDARPWVGQGLRFGVAVALLTAVPTYTIYFVVQPTPGSLAVGQMIGDGVLIVVLALIAAYIYRPSPQAT
jgi:hypothetical protein